LKSLFKAVVPSQQSLGTAPHGYPCDLVGGGAELEGCPGLGYNPLSRIFAVMDLRLLVVIAPILLAASWAVFHIGRAAVGQLQLFIKRAQA